MAFYLILDKVKIREGLGRKSEVKFFSFVSEDLLSLPGLDQLLTTSSHEVNREIVRQMASQVLNQWESIEVQNADGDDIFTWGTGRILHRSDTIPRSFDWLMLVIESDEDLRQLGEKIGEILPDSKVDSLAMNIMALASIGTSAVGTAAIAISKALIAGIASILKNNENDQLGLVEQSFIRELHYPEGTLTVAGATDVTGRMWLDYRLLTDSN